MQKGEGSFSDLKKVTDLKKVLTLNNKLVYIQPRLGGCEGGTECLHGDEPLWHYHGKL